MNTINFQGRPTTFYDRAQEIQSQQLPAKTRPTTPSVQFSGRFTDGFGKLKKAAAAFVDQLGTEAEDAVREQKKENPIPHLREEMIRLKGIGERRRKHFNTIIGRYNVAKEDLDALIKLEHKETTEAIAAAEALDAHLEKHPESSQPEHAEHEMYLAYTADANQQAIEMEEMTQKRKQQGQLVGTLKLAAEEAKQAKVDLAAEIKELQRQLTEAITVWQNAETQKEIQTAKKMMNDLTEDNIALPGSIAELIKHARQEAASVRAEDGDSMTVAQRRAELTRRQSVKIDQANARLARVRSMAAKQKRKKSAE